ncbi:MAG: porin family protein [Bacteroidota bacterium]|nr:hypothetical protein [Christiangramia sp.]MEE2772156.1 porin family protein [Bacteroidota bacterium]
MKNALFVLFLFSCIYGFAQERELLTRLPDTVPTSIDSLYREDQLYVGFSFNLITDKPSTIGQQSFSGGLHLGMIRDFPLNKRRNIALGAGLGWSLNSYGQNLKIDQDSQGNTIFSSLENNQDYQTNRFTTQLIEAPIEFRWRTSTPETYKFWRIYTGLRLGYIYRFRSNYKDANGQLKLHDLPELDRFRIGTTFTFGYNTFNFQFYYALNPFFKNAEVDQESFGISTLQIGLNFYIL